VYYELLPPKLVQVYYLKYFNSGSVPELVQARLTVARSILELTQNMPPELVQVRVAQC